MTHMGDNATNKTVLHRIPTFPDIPVIRGTKKGTIRNQGWLWKRNIPVAVIRPANNVTRSP